MIREVTVGLGVIAGIAVLEAALIPVVVIGGAAVLAPKYLPRLRRSLQPAFDSIFSESKPAAASDGSAVKLPLAVPETLKIRQAVAKTITFRIIATTLDFTTENSVRRRASRVSPWCSVRCSISPTKRPGTISARPEPPPKTRIRGPSDRA